MKKETGKKRRVMVGSIGDCVHSLGVETFAEWMEDKSIGYYAVKLGPAVPIQDVINKIREARPTIVGVSSRLGDLHVDKLIREFMDKAIEHKIDPKSSGIRYSFGGLRPAANLVRAMTGQEMLADKFSPPDDRNYDLDQVAADYAPLKEYHDFFELIVDDYVTMDELERFAQGLPPHVVEEQLWSDDLLERIREVRERENRPILRAHIGIAAESVDPTIEDIEEVSDAHALEIVSLGPDQPSQAYLAKFIRGEEDPGKYLKGQGGVPIRSEEELIKLKEATRRGNYPTIRIYSGTDELLELAKLFEKHFNMPFPAVPIFFYNELDGRGPIAIREGFDEHMEVISWWAEQNKPVEINDPHQWQLRNCSDDMYAFDHLICALIALRCGVKNYIMQLMFDLPPEISSRNDLAKMMASYELIEPLTRHFDFNIIKETRGGLSSFPPNLDMAKGHLAVTTHMQMYMDPDIIHVVSFPEAHHEAKAPDIIESCDIVKQVVKDFNLGDQPDVTADPKFQERKEELKVGVMYNALHLALMGGYEGKVTRENYKIWAVSKVEAAKRSDPEEREMHFESMLLDLIDDNSYRGGACGIVSADTLDLSLQTGLCQAPQLTVLDKRYEMVGKCRTKMVKGACRIDAFNKVKVESELERVDTVYNRTPWFFNKDISMADDQSHISELGEELDEVVAQFRNQLDLHEFEHKKILVVDFGSTFTKVGIFDTDTEEFSLKYVPTTVDDLREGLANGLGVLDQCRKAENWDPLSQKMEEFDVKLPCSSAKGGLKMVTVSLVKEESGFAAELAALTAGAKLLNSYEGFLTEGQARQIYEIDQPEIILIAGGVNDGGEKETQLHNARLLAEGARKADYARYGVPIIYAGNEDIADEIKAIFTDSGVDVRITGNVMPEVNTYSIEVVNEAIRELFQTIIIRGKGFDVVEEYMSAKFIPTPRAAFLGINLLSKGYGREKGLGNIVALDIGGCTTDFYANVLENPLYLYPGKDARRRVKRTILKTPNAPLAYRRVEGKYGLSYNAENILELPRFQDGSIKAELKEYFNKRYPNFKKQGDPFDQFAAKEYGPWDFKLEEMLRWINANPHIMPVTEEWNTVFAFLAREIMKIATSNNVGYVEETDTYFMQYGVNFFTHDTNLLLIGGTIYHKCIEGLEYHGKDLELIASGALYNECEGNVLRPNGQVYMDAQYLVSILGGLYGRLDPERALRMMKRFLQKMEVRDELCKGKIAIL